MSFEIGVIIGIAIVWCMITWVIFALEFYTAFKMTRNKKSKNRLLNIFICSLYLLFAPITAIWYLIYAVYKEVRGN